MKTADTCILYINGHMPMHFLHKYISYLHLHSMICKATSTQYIQFNNVICAVVYSYCTGLHEVIQSSLVIELTIIMHTIHRARSFHYVALNSAKYVHVTLVAKITRPICNALGIHTYCNWFLLDLGLVSS